MAKDTLRREAVEAAEKVYDSYVDDDISITELAEAFDDVIDQAKGDWFCPFCNTSFTGFRGSREQLRNAAKEHVESCSAVPKGRPDFKSLIVQGSLFEEKKAELEQAEEVIRRKDGSLIAASTMLAENDKYIAQLVKQLEEKDKQIKGLIQQSRLKHEEAELKRVDTAKLKGVCRTLGELADTKDKELAKSADEKGVIKYQLDERERDLSSMKDARDVANKEVDELKEKDKTRDDKVGAFQAKLHEVMEKHGILKTPTWTTDIRYLDIEICLLKQKIKELENKENIHIEAVRGRDRAMAKIKKESEQGLADTQLVARIEEDLSIIFDRHGFYSTGARRGDLAYLDEKINHFRNEIQGLRERSADPSADDAKQLLMQEAKIAELENKLLSVLTSTPSVDDVKVGELKNKLLTSELTLGEVSRLLTLFGINKDADVVKKAGIAVARIQAMEKQIAERRTVSGRQPSIIPPSMGEIRRFVDAIVIRILDTNYVEPLGRVKVADVIFEFFRERYHADVPTATDDDRLKL